MNRTNIAGGMTAAQYYAAMNGNYKKSYLGSNWFNVEEYGAVHDDNTDDTDAVQAAINDCWTAGGGVVFFPNGIYKIAGALKTSVTCVGNGPINYNSQIYIPYLDFTANYTNSCVIKLLGETPSLFLQNVQTLRSSKGVILKSTIAGSGALPSVICSKGPASPYGMNYNDTVIENITVLVNPFIATTGPSMSAVNLLYSGFSRIENLFTGLDLSDLSTSIIPVNNVHGLIIGVLNNNFAQIGSYSCMGGFTYGITIGEGIHANNIFCAKNYIGLHCLTGAYGSIIDNAILHWNTYDIASQQETIGEVAGKTTLRIHFLNSEDSVSPELPVWCNRVDEILDVDNYLYGEISYNMGFNNGGVGHYITKSNGGLNFLIKNIYKDSFFHWATTERPASPGLGCMGFNTTSSKMEAWDGSQWNNLW